jgi:gliding motility-associated lipoprotein GldH
MLRIFDRRIITSKKIMRRLSLFACCFTGCLLIFSSCDRKRIFEENKQITDYKWNYADAPTFVTEVKDTNTHYNVIVNVRHSFEFEWRNLWVKIQTTLPDGRTSEKRINLVLSEPDGHWHGDCLGDNCDLQIPIQENAIFPVPGKYTFKITQDMRVNPLPLVKSIGLRIEKAAS